MSYVSLKNIKEQFNIKDNNIYQVQPQENSIVIKLVGKLAENSRNILIKEFKMDEYNFSCNLVSILLEEKDLQYAGSKHVYPITKVIIHNENIIICGITFVFLPNNTDKIGINKSAKGKFGIVMEIGEKLIMIKLIDKFVDNNMMFKELIEACYDDRVHKCLRSINSSSFVKT